MPGSEETGEAMVDRLRHIGLWRTPTKKRLRSDVLQAARKRKCKIAVMSEYSEKDADELPPVTPPGKEKEVLATVVSHERDGVLNAVLEQLKALEIKHTEQIEALQMQVNSDKALKIKHTEQIEALQMQVNHLSSLLTSSRALALRFFAEYVVQLYKQAGGKNVLTSNESKLLTVTHAVEGFNDQLPLNSEIISKLKKISNIVKKVSRKFCHAGSVKEAANAILDVARFRPEWKKIVSDEALVACEEMFVEVFGITPQDAVASEESKHNEVFPIGEMRRRGKWTPKSDSETTEF